MPATQPREIGGDVPSDGFAENTQRHHQPSTVWTVRHGMERAIRVSGSSSEQHIASLHGMILKITDEDGLLKDLTWMICIYDGSRDRPAEVAGSRVVSTDGAGALHHLDRWGFGRAEERMMVRVVSLAFVAWCTVLGAAGPALASGCFPVAGLAPRLVPVSLRTAALPGGATARLTFLGHASFLIETAGGASAVTDYNGYVKASQAPDIVTMNNAHGTHYTDAVEPGVKHVLRGWNP
ncbi:MAG TPA: MBL fold metallo-hydrolase, partial [Geminicoccaceae bacterium]|nr:MBL fold metallo-hydrolase [Geminicoccaceae bacterium]